jgi:hypothetical protein
MRQKGRTISTKIPSHNYSLSKEDIDIDFLQKIWKIYREESNARMLVATSMKDLIEISYPIITNLNNLNIRGDYFEYKQDKPYKNFYFLISDYLSEWRNKQIDSILEDA